MASFMYPTSRKVLVFYLFCCLFTSLLLLCASTDSESEIEAQFQRKLSIGRRRMLAVDTDEEEEDKPLPKIKKPTTSSSTKNQTKPLKPKSDLSTKNQTKLIKPKSDLSTKNQTKLIKPKSNGSTTNSTKSQKPSSSPPLISKPKLELKKLNSTKKSSSSSSTSDLMLKPATPKNKTSKPSSNLDSDQKPKKTTQSTDKKIPNQQQQKKPTKPISSWFEDETGDDDLVSEFRDLPTRFQQTLIPDLERISTTSKIYINRANKEMTNGFKPIVGKKYASTIASIVSFAFIVIPLLLVSLIFNRIKAYFSIQKLLIFIQIYLSIYFSILCLSSLVTGLEPLKYFYATSQSAYVCIQILQTLGYVLYLLLLMMYLILVFSTDCGLGPKFLGLGQTLVGLAVGLHYYVSVFHKVVLHQPPKTNWKVHGIYATCFLVISVLAQAERRKKAYLEEGGEEGKKS